MPRRHAQANLPKPEGNAPWKMMRVISGHLGWVRCIAVDPTNEWFVTGSADRTIKRVGPGLGHAEADADGAHLDGAWAGGLGAFCPTSSPRARTRWSSAGTLSTTRSSAITTATSRGCIRSRCILLSIC